MYSGSVWRKPSSVPNTLLFLTSLSCLFLPTSTLAQDSQLNQQKPSVDSHGYALGRMQYDLYSKKSLNDYEQKPLENFESISALLQGGGKGSFSSLTPANPCSLQLAHPPLNQADRFLLTARKNPFFHPPLSSGECPTVDGLRYSSVKETLQDLKKNTAYPKPFLKTLQYFWPQTADITSDCLHPELWNKVLGYYAQLYSEGTLLGDVSLEELISILKKVETTQERQHQAMLTKATSSESCGSSQLPDCFIIYLPSGEILISYKNKALGKGAFKAVSTRIKLNADPTLPNSHPFESVAVAESHNKKGQKELIAEGTIMKMIKEKFKTQTEGLLVGELILNPDGTHSLLMPKMRGTLSERLKNPNVSPLKKLELLKDSLQGLIKMHQLGLIHSDLKPGNILIKSERGADGSSKERALIADYGLSEALAGWDNDKTGKSYLLNGGTLGYTSPERIASRSNSPAQTNLKTVQKSDVYSFGVMLDILAGNKSSEFVTATRKCKDQFPATSPAVFDQYRKCNEDNVKALHEDRLKELEKKSQQSDKDALLEKTILQTLDPNPAKRPTPEELDTSFDQLIQAFQ